MTISGKEFRSDLIIHPDGRIQDSWWRAQGHNLAPDDIRDVLDTAPEKLIIGTGASGLMSVSRNMMEWCEKHGVEVEVSRTAESVTRFNETAKTGTSIAACFHLTC